MEIVNTLAHANMPNDPAGVSGIFALWREALDRSRSDGSVPVAAIRSNEWPRTLYVISAADLEMIDRKLSA
jgi:hypothetical protein